MLGVIADIHANLPALEKVLEKLEGAERILCAGDLVGYGPYPAEVIDTVREEGIICVTGNHDWAVVNNDLSWFNPLAREAIKYTRRVLSPGYIAFLRSLPWKMEDESMVVVHGSPRDPLFEYFFPREEAEKLTVVGHSHVQFFRNNFLNPGSVGQPRDGDPRAAFAVIEGEKVKLRRTRYNIDEVAEEIEKVGLPSFLALRLYEGR